MEVIEKLQIEVEQLKSAIAELTVLNDIAMTASTLFEVDDVLDAIVKKSIKAVNAEQGSIQLVTDMKDKPLQTLIRQGDFSGVVKSYRLSLNITGWVLKNEQPLIIDDLANDERFQATDQETDDVKSAICLPIRYKAKIIGLLMILNKKSGETFNAADKKLLSIIAAQSGQLIRHSQLQQEAIEKNRLVHELGLARKMQMSLVPNENPKFDGLDIASYFNPADAVGGDYFDYFDLGDGKIGIVIADVSGHGPSAALMMTMMKGVFHSTIPNLDSISDAMQEINAVLSRTLPQDIFITMLFMLFDSKNKVLQFSNAGHNPFVYYKSKDKSCQLFEFPGFALNLIPDATYSMQEIKLEADDLFILYTDGVTEAVDNNMKMYNTDSLMNVTKENVSGSAIKIVREVKNDLYGFIGNTKQDDDIAFIAIKIHQDVTK